MRLQDWDEALIRGIEAVAFGRDALALVEGSDMSAADSDRNDQATGYRTLQRALRETTDALRSLLEVNNELESAQDDGGERQDA